MYNQSQSQFYDISIKGLSDVSSFEYQARKAMDEIRAAVGTQQISRLYLEPVSKKKNIYELSFYTEADGCPITISKKGKKIFSLLRKVKKAVKKTSREVKLKKCRKKREFNKKKFLINSWERAS